MNGFNGDYPLITANWPRIEDASSILRKHVNNKETFQLQSFRRAIGVTISKDLSRKNMRRSFHKDCTLLNTKMISVGFLGSLFVSTKFKNAIFDYWNFHSCSFENVEISSKNIEYTIKSAGFHKSRFTNTIFNGIRFFSCGFTDVHFINCSFINCIFTLCSFENASLIRCKLENVDMSNVNLEFSRFESLEFKNTTLPFATLSGIYNGLTQIIQSNNVWISSKESHRLSTNEYINLFPAFASFYYESGVRTKSWTKHKGLDFVYTPTGSSRQEKS